MSRPQFIRFVEPARVDMPLGPTEEESAKIAEHLDYLEEQLAAGNLILCGRTHEPPFMGISIFEAENAEAAAKFSADDPAVKAGIFKVIRIQAYRVALQRSVGVDAER
jgi:uncharacterized protein YciI